MQNQPGRDRRPPTGPEVVQNLGLAALIVAGAIIITALIVFN